jgi:RimJ/RimL family protein N-acetyltransferase
MYNSNNRLTLRLVVKSDETLLYDWANDPEVRKWSFSKVPISLNEHKSWFHKKINDSNVLIWIFEDCHSPAGMIRLEKKDKKVLLNYLIGSESRGKKLASKMLKLAINEVVDYWENIKVFAYTVPGNISSIKSLEKAGFTLESSGDENKCYIYNINNKMGATLE